MTATAPAMPSRPAARLRRSIILAATVMAFAVSLVGPRVGLAAVNLTVTPISWDVVGLDHNDQTAGPDTFPAGARACNTGSTTATNVVATFTWDSANTRINLVGASYGAAHASSWQATSQLLTVTCWLLRKWKPSLFLLTRL